MAKKKDLPEALTSSQIDDKLAAIAAENTAAETLLQSLCNDAARWDKIKARARNMGTADAQFTALCGKLVRTRKEWQNIEPGARGVVAFHALLTTVGIRLTDADEATFAAVEAPPAS